jgi:chromosome segregation ATPase
MTSENQALLDAIRGVVEEVVAPLADRIERIEVEQREQRLLLQSINSRLDSIEARLTSLETRMTSLEARMTSLEERVSHLEDSVERLDMRTAQISRELYELHERMDRGFTSLKRETELALGQVSRVENGQKTQQKRIKELEDRVALLQQRVEKLEDLQNAE